MAISNIKRDLPQVVQDMGEIQLQGPLVDSGWFNHITNEKGKPNLLAIFILSEIVYWYRPKVNIDEATGAVISVKKRFAADMMQKSYKDLGERFGVTKRQAQEACIFLKNLDLIKIEQRTITKKSGAKVPNVTYMEPIPQNIKKITLLCNEYKDPIPKKCEAKGEDAGIPEKCDTPSIPENCDIPVPEKCETNTETTSPTENTPVVVVVGASEKKMGISAEEGTGETEAYKSLVDMFNVNICELKPRSISEQLFLNYYKHNSSDFIKSVIGYCNLINIGSFAGFELSIQDFLSKGADTPEKVLKAIEKFRDDKKKARRPKDKAKKITPQPAPKVAPDKYEGFYL